MDFCYRDNLCSAILNRVNHVQHRSYTHINQIFCRYEKAILINGEILNRGYHVVLNKAVFKYFFEEILMIKCNSENDFNTAFRDIQRYPDFYVFPKSKYDPFIYTIYNQRIDRNDDKLLIYDDINSSAVFLGQLGFPLYPGNFMDKCSFSDEEEAILADILSEKIKNLAYLSVLTAAVYCYNNPIKKPTVFYAEDISTLKSAFDFLELLFNHTICELRANEYISPELNTGSLAEKMFSGGMVFAIDLTGNNKINILSFDGIRKLAKGSYLYGNDITIRNHFPVIVFTDNRRICNKLERELDSNVIEFENFSNDFIYWLNTTNCASIRQALTLLGLSELKKTTIKFNKNHEKDTITKNFCSEFISDNEDNFVPKSLLRDSFAKYLKKIGRENNFKSIEICNLLKARGYDVKSKKRTNIDKNPVAVVKGIQFETEKFNRFMIGEYKIKLYSCENEEMLRMLRGVTPKFYRLPIIRSTQDEVHG